MRHAMVKISEILLNFKGLIRLNHELLSDNCKILYSTMHTVVKTDNDAIYKHVKLVELLIIL